MGHISKATGPTERALGLLPPEVEEGPPARDSDMVTEARRPAHEEAERRRKAEAEEAKDDEHERRSEAAKKAAATRAQKAEGDGEPVRGAKDGTETVEGGDAQSGDGGQPATPPEHRTDPQTDHEAAEKGKTAAGRTSKAAAVKAPGAKKD